jgi:hypothetical protein
VKIRKFEVEKDIHEVIRWFENEEWPYPPVEDLLPDMGVVSVNEHDVPLACCFVYTTSTSLGQLSWIAASREITLTERMEAVRAAIEAIQKVAMKLEPKMRLIEIVTRDRSLEPVLKDLGFWVKYGFLKATYMAPNDESNETKR